MFDNKLLNRIQQLSDINITTVIKENTISLLETDSDINKYILSLLKDAELTLENGEITIILENEVLTGEYSETEIIDELNKKENYKNEILKIIGTITDKDIRIQDYNVYPDSFKNIIIDVLVR